MNVPTDDTVAVLIAAPVIAALVWLVRANATKEREREARSDAAAIKREEAQAETLRRFANAADKQAEATASWAAATATNSTVMQSLTGAIERLSTSLTAEVRGIREDLDELTPTAHHERDDTPVARPRAIAGGFRRPQPGQKDET